jgi:hypothetical protein
MSGGLFWLADAPFEPIRPHLPTDTRSKARVGDRRNRLLLVMSLDLKARVLYPVTVQLRRYMYYGVAPGCGGL